MTHPIAQHLYRIQAETGDRFFKLYADWLHLAVSALAREEDQYMEIVRRYGPRIEGKVHPADRFAQALGELMLACREASERDGTFPDILGRIYEEESAANKHSGQFFTPEPICDLMAAISVAPDVEPATIADCACGSGRLLIAAMRTAPAATLYGVDLDLTCVHMATLNMLFRNASAYIIHGNSLTMEVFGGYRTFPTAIGGELRKLSKQEAHQVLVPRVRAIAAEAQVVLGDAEQVRATNDAAQRFVENSKGQYEFEV